MVSESTLIISIVGAVFASTGFGRSSQVLSKAKSPKTAQRDKC